MIRYSPDAMKRLHEYEDDLKRRIRDGSLTPEEGMELLAARVRREATVDPPRKVKCAYCGTTYDIVGVGQTFQCPCHQDPQSVLDCRVT